jgi:hypothetical protein
MPVFFLLLRDTVSSSLPNPDGMSAPSPLSLPRMVAVGAVANASSRSVGGLSRLVSALEVLEGSSSGGAGPP